MGGAVMRKLYSFLLFIVCASLLSAQNLNAPNLPNLFMPNTFSANGSTTAPVMYLNGIWSTGAGSLPQMVIAPSGTTRYVSDGNGQGLQIVSAGTGGTAISTGYGTTKDFVVANNGAVTATSLSISNSVTTGGFYAALSTKTAAYTLSSSTDFTILCNATSGAITISLPTTVSKQIFNIKKTDSSSNACTVSGNGHNIDGGATSTLASQYANLRVQGDGVTQWWVI